MTLLLLVGVELPGNSTILSGGGVVGIITGALAFIIVFGQAINEAYEKKIVPL